MSSTDNLVERNWRSLTFPNRGGQSLAFAAMTFILAPMSVHGLLLAVANKFEAPEILEHGDCAAAKYLDSLFRK